MDQPKKRKKGSIISKSQPPTVPESLPSQTPKRPKVGTPKGTVMTSTPLNRSPEEIVKAALTKTVDKTPEDPFLPLTFLTRIPTRIVADHEDFIPKYKTRGAACCDLVANIPPGENGRRIVTLLPGATICIDCGFSMQLMPGYEAQVRARSGLAREGLICTNSPGTIDDDYRGRVTILLTNVGRNVMVINHKDRVGQMALKPVWYFSWDVVQELDPSERGDGGFGSTGLR